MKVGIFIYSQSGHTVSFARTIAEHLRKAGIDTDIELLRCRGIPKPWTRNIEFRRIPDVTEYDIILFGGPVWAFNASRVILAFIQTIDSLKGKKAIPFVTHGLPLKFGPKRALKNMSKKLDVLCADVLEGESVHYIIRANKTKLNEAVERIVERVKS